MLERRTERSLFLLSLENSRHHVALVLSATVLTELSAGESDGLLLLGRITGSEHLQHLALVWGESGNLVDDRSDGLDSLVEAALAEGELGLAVIWVLLWLSHDVTVVDSYKEACLLCFHHL